jgi:GT2 family glycosyltransferase
MATTSVVIASHNKHDYLAATLGCLARQSVLPDEVLVVDDASDPPLNDLGGDIRLVRREPTPHVQAARNQGIALAQGELILLLDDDCLVREDWVRSHVWRHARDPRYVVAGSVRRIVYQGEPQFWDLPPAPGVHEHRTFEFRTEQWCRDTPPWNLAPCSNNASVPRAALLEVGGYDEAYRGWGVDDVDLTYRLMRSGLSLLMDAGPVVHHQEHPWCPRAREEQETRNLWVFAQRHGFWAYGTPPPEFAGPRRYPSGGAWFHARKIVRLEEPDAIEICFVPAPAPDAQVPRGPLEWVFGSPGSRE